MGLSQGEETGPEAATILAWLLPAALVVMAFALLPAGDAAKELLRYDRSGIANGEIWRLVTGHFVHLNLSHTALNAAGVLLVWYLVGREFRPTEWLWVVAGSIAAIDIGLWFASPTVGWYVGLSGVLHGLLAAGVVAGYRTRRLESVIIGVIVAAKLAFEQAIGPLPGSESASGGNVVVDAHLYGVIGGLLVGLLLIRVRRKSAI